MQYRDLIDSIGLVSELKKDAMLVMVSKTEKDVFKKAAELDDRGLSDWIRWLARTRARQLGLTLSSDENQKTKPKKTDP